MIINLELLACAVCLRQKWSGFELENVVVELQAASIYRKSRNKQQQLWDNDEDEENKLFAAFKFNCIPERRPFILSRDFVFAKPTGRNVDPFQVSFQINHRAWFNWLTVICGI